MKLSRRAVVLTLLASMAWFALSEVSANESQAVILMYHHFGVDEYPSTNVRLEQFEAHLDHLAEAGYRVWPLDKVVDYLQRKQAFPGRVVAITVDDAYDSVYDVAFPMLQKRGWPFTVFVATDGIDQGIKAYMSWDQLRELNKHGVILANHSASHDYLIRRIENESESQWLSRIKADINRAANRLQQELGTSPGLLAYPYGEYNTVLANMIEGMGYVAFGQQSGPAGFSDDLRALPRFPMAEAFADITDFRTKLASLAFPLQEVSPWEPEVNGDIAPELILQLGESNARLSQLNCFFSAGGKMDIEWLDHSTRRLKVITESGLPAGRSRYNCTAPSLQSGRYYWYSHLWIRAR